MYARILVPMDGSNASATALSEALRFAREQHATVRLVHVCEPPQYILAQGPVDLDSEIRKQGETTVLAAVDNAREQGIAVESTIVDAADRRVADAIVKEAVRWGADLIAMGSHGRHGFEHFLLGSVTEGVLRRATVPVLVLRCK